MPLVDEYIYLVVSVILAPLDRAYDAACKELIRWNKLTRFSIARRRFEPASICVHAPPAGGSHASRLALYEPLLRPGWTVMFTNLADGWHSLLWCMNRNSALECFHFSVSRADDEYPRQCFQYLGLHERERVVYVMRDNGSVFWQQGEPHEAETPADYNKRRVRDRLTRQSVIDITRRIGCDISDDRFWTSNGDAIYLEERAPPAQPVD